MKKICNLICTPPLFCLLMSSCAVTTSVYNVTNVPMFQKEKEVQTTAYIGFDHTELQTAYSFDSIKGIILNGYVGYAGFSRDTTSIKSFFFEGGYCYSKNLNKKRKLEFIGGYGYGKKDYYQHYAYEERFLFSAIEQTEILYDFETRFHRLFAQINYGDNIGKNPESKSTISISLRGLWLFYTKYNFLYKKYDLNKNYFIPVQKDSSVLRNKSVFIIEPSVTLRVGTEPVYFNLQTGPAFGVGNPSIKEFAYSSPFLRFGISVIIDRK